MTDTDRRIRSATRQAVHYRNYRRARERALTQLAQQYPTEYKILLEREKANDKSQGKRWLDIDGSTDSNLDIHTELPTTGKFHTTQTENQSNDGGQA